MSSIDVVIPCYRYGRYLRHCVQSVLAQEIDALRVLIIDDASPDETFEVGAALAAEDARVTYRRHSSNRGHLATFNEGIDWCLGDAMLLLSADDYLLPGALKRAMVLMENHPEMGLCFGDALCLQENGAILPMPVPVEGGDGPVILAAGSAFARLCVQAGANNVVCTPTAVVRTSLLRKWGGYRTDLPHSGDLELWLRLSAHAPVGIVRTDQAVYRRHATNMSSAYFQDHGLSDLKQRKAAFDAFMYSCGTYLADRRALRLSFLAALADEAMGHANSAFNGNRMVLSACLCDFALGAYPRVRRTPLWRLLACKKLLGVRVSTALLRPLKLLRARLARLRGEARATVSMEPRIEARHEP